MVCLQRLKTWNRIVTDFDFSWPRKRYSCCFGWTWPIYRYQRYTPWSTMARYQCWWRHNRSSWQICGGKRLANILKDFHGMIPRAFICFRDITIFIVLSVFYDDDLMASLADNVQSVLFISLWWNTALVSRNLETTIMLSIVWTHFDAMLFAMQMTFQDTPPLSPYQRLAMGSFVSVKAGTKWMIGLRNIMLVTDTFMKHQGIIRRFRGLSGVPRVVRTGRKLISILWLIMML